MREILGYKLFRCDVKSANERGVAIVIKSSFNAKILNLRTENCANIEYVCISVQIEKYKSIIICCVYRHPVYSTTTLQADHLFLRTLLTEICDMNKSIYVLGDFNLNSQKSIEPLNTTITQLNLDQIINTPTRGENILDLIIVNKINTVTHSEV